MSKEKESKATVRYLFGLAKTQNARLYGSVIFGVLSGIAMFIPFYAVYRVMLVLFDEADSNIIFWGAIAAVCIVLRFLFHGISGTLSHVCAYNVLYEVRKKICEHLGKVNLGYFGENSSGEVKKVLMEDVERLEHFLAHQIPDITTAIAVPVIVLIFLMTVNVPMALILLVPIIISFIVQGIMLAVYKPMVEEGTVLQGQMNSAVVQFVTGMPVMKAYNLNAEIYSTYADTSKNYNFLWKKVSKSAAPLSAICTVLTESGIAFSVPFGGCLMLKGSLTATEYVFFIIMSIVFLAAFNNLMSFAQIFSQISAGIERIKLVMEVPELTTDTQNIHAPSESFIEFRNVSFAYKEKNVLDNINLSLGKGTITAFVGVSGAGKSTAAQLMPRFWDVTEGEILIDGRNIKSYSSAELMSMLSFVFQESFLMDATIYENISMGDPDASKEAVILAAKSAQIHDRIMDLPEGYDTKYGTAGVKLSGGERQRICIARAILKNAPKTLFNQMLDYALEYELVDRNYSRTFKLTDETIKEIQTVKKEHIAFSDEEIETLWKSIGVLPGIDILLIQCYSGWRPQELGLLELKNTDLENWTFKGGIKTDAGTDRTVPIHSKIRKLVETKYREAVNLDSPYLLNWVVPGMRKKNYKLTYPRYQKAFGEIVTALRLNPEHRPHDGRTHFVTTAKRYGVDEYAIKYMVGHKISDITEKTYTKRKFEWLKQEIEKIP